MAETILEVDDLVKHFPITRGIVFKKTVGQVKAVDGVSLDLESGETLGVVGESGCGKSTLARVLMNLEKPTAGTVRYKGSDIFKLRRRGAAPAAPPDPARHAGPVHLAQPAHDGRRHHRRAVRDPPRGGAEGQPRAARCRSCSTSSGSTRSTSTATRTSSPAASASASASPGRSRCSPEIIVCDEPVSALDVSIQAQVMNLLEKLQDEFGPVVHLHRPRPVGGAPPLGPGRGDVPRQDRRGRHRGRDLRAADAPVHAGAAVGGAGAGPDACASTKAIIRLDGDVPSPGQPAVGLPVPHPVLEGRRRSAPRRSRRWRPRRGSRPPERLPLRREQTEIVVTPTPPRQT